MNTKQKVAFYRSKIGHHGVKDWREVARAGHYWSKSLARRAPAYGPRIDGTQKRWIENVDAAGLRFVDFADDIIRLNHRGWYIDPDDWGATYRGAVWQLPSRGGVPVYVYGYKCPHNPGAALVDFESTPDKDTAARWADDVAEADAEEAREFYERGRLEQEAEDLRATIADTRAEVRRLLRERRALKAHGDNATVCRLFRDKVRDLLAEARKARARLDVIGGLL